MRLRCFFGIPLLVAMPVALAGAWKPVQVIGSNTVCSALSSAMNKGEVSLREPVCHRQLQISATASALGLESVGLQAVNRRDYRHILVQILMVEGLTNEKAEALADKDLRESDFTMYTAVVDVLNEGHARNIYLLAYGLCTAPWFSNPSMPTIYVQNEDGTLDPYWRRDTVGFPFIYQHKTYYAQWVDHGPQYPEGLSVAAPLRVGQLTPIGIDHESFAKVCGVERRAG